MRTWVIFLMTHAFLLSGHYCTAQSDSYYLTALQKADSAYSFRNWEGKDNPADSAKFKAAKKLFVIALQIQPTATYPASRIKEIEKILHELKVKTIYDKLILQADSLFLAENFRDAKTYYSKAEALYATEYTKDKLSSIQALTILSQNATNEITYIKHGVSFGECIMDCMDESTFTANLLVNHRNSGYKDQTNKSDSIKLEISVWQNLIAAIDLKAFFMLPRKLGCPDCYDGGAEWLIIGTKNTEWKVVFEYGSDTIATKNLLAIIRKMKN